MKIEIINKPMLCWDEDESDAEEFHVLAIVKGCKSDYPFKVLNSNGCIFAYKHCKPIPETVEMTIAEICKALGKQIKIIE